MMHRFKRILLLLTVALLLDGCATTTLPDYAAPTVSVVDEASLDLSDVIRYRKLSRADFKGTQPPTDFDERMAAVTCVYTQPVVDKTAIDIVHAETSQGQPAYNVTYNNLSYHALMNRNCSWWNPNTPADEEDYVLEHEQIHFALFEIAAREWSQLPAMEIRVKADSVDAMKAELQARFEAILQQRLDILLQQNRRFDEETSLGHDPVKQEKWLRQVRSKLPVDAD